MSENKTTISQILKQSYGFDNDFEISTIKAGVENENFLVLGPKDKYIFRIYNNLHSIRGERNDRSISLELQFMESADKHGLPVPKIIKSVDDKLFAKETIEGEKKYIALFTFIDGNMANSYNGKISAQVGKIVSQMYEVGQAFVEIDEENFKQNNIIDRAFNKFTELKNSGITIDEKISNLAEKLSQQALEIKNKKINRGLVHGDLKLENLLFSDDEIVGVLDFDDYRFSYLIEEAVMTLMHDLHSREENLIRSGHYVEFIDAIKNPDLKGELTYLKFFLQIRFLYDLCKYSLKNKAELVKELFQDNSISQHII